MESAEWSLLINIDEIITGYMRIIPPLERYLIFMNVILLWIYWIIRLNWICDLLISSIESFSCDLFNFTEKY